MRDRKNENIKKLIIQRYPDSVDQEDKFIQSEEHFFELRINTVSQWIYEVDIPIGFAEKTL